VSRAAPDEATVRAYDRAAPPPERTRTATFGLGCFWGPDARFGATDGVVRTRVGYAGGTTPDPTYHEIGDHTEVVQVDYDPRRLRYEDLLRAAFDAHDSRRQPRARQYQHVVLCGPGQRESVERFLADRFPDPDRVATRVEDLGTFTAAEDYHQKYRLRSDPAFRAFQDYDDRAVRESPAAAALNGAAAGHGRPPALDP
jgi:peptide-methionine (S)-S-oxide reductase